MKLLFDQNLSPRLVGFFENIFAGSKHLTDFNLERSDDAIVWEFATLKSDLNLRPIYLKTDEASMADGIPYISHNVSFKSGFVYLDGRLRIA